MQRVEEKKQVNQKVKAKLSELQKDEGKNNQANNKKDQNKNQSGKKVTIKSDSEDSPRKIDTSGQGPNAMITVKPLELLVSGFIPKIAPTDINYITISSNGSKKYTYSYQEFKTTAIL